MMVDMGLAATSTLSPIELQKTIVDSSAPRKFPPMAEPISSFQYYCLNMSGVYGLLRATNVYTDKANNIYEKLRKSSGTGKDVLKWS